jgi:hypothetical protein
VNAKTAHVNRMLGLVREHDVELDEQTSGGFDGGAREPVQVTESHGETLIAILRSRGADAGQSFDG